ncbi:hypothetical protein R9C00_25415 [Flammeovirgaceae bacterium SG7u.111]|nr:hypothetical protein [Flammeovirgaceae bacterium SG7u.132]WPO35036.1 hypothetical protein R9C00_25415 [Flammeovirgaceae bacterium SG7u.111]
MGTKGKSLFLFLMLASAYGAFGQNTTSQFFQSFQLNIDTGVYTLKDNSIRYRGKEYLSFYYDNENEICELSIVPRPSANIASLELLKSNDFVATDSLVFFNSQYYRTKIRFKDLSTGRFQNFTFKITDRSGKETITEIRLFPYTNTQVDFHPKEKELFIGEEKTFELFTNHLDNIATSNTWTEGKDIDYRLSKENGRLVLHVIPHQIGTHLLNVKISTIKPFLKGSKTPIFSLKPLQEYFEVKESRLAFLSINKKDITKEDDSHIKGIEIEIEDNPKLLLNKTYRLEQQELPGGALVAELFTRNRLSNGRILCWLRPYTYHSPSDGYLYIKDGDEAKFIANFSISPKTSISKLSLMRNGQDWTEHTAIYPGEIIDVKIEGEGLNKAKLKFDGLFRIMSDSAINNDKIKIMTLKIPIMVYKKRLDLYNHGIPTGFNLMVNEFQKAQQLDFVKISNGETESLPITQFNTPILYSKNINDIVLSFDNTMLDKGDTLLGKQYLTIDIKVTNKQRQLVESHTINDVVICPSESSIRYRYYDLKDCNRGSININNYLRTKTHQMEEWSKIELTIYHRKNMHREGGYKHKVEIYYAKTYTFDVDVSFPAGLLIRELDGENSDITSFTGISLAAIAQFTFYNPKSIAKVRPYKVGAGILAINAFNFSSSDDVQRDLALVALGSVYPLRRDNRKLSFPLHAGFGYYLQDKKWFFLVGPGIRIRF